MNETAWNATNATTTLSLSLSTTMPVAPLPDEGEVEKEHHYSMTIFFILLVLGKVHYLRLFLRTILAARLHVRTMWHAGWQLTCCSLIMPSLKCFGAHQPAVSTRSQIVPFVSESQPCNRYPLYATFGHAGCRCHHGRACLRLLSSKQVLRHCDGSVACGIRYQIVP